MRCLWVAHLSFQYWPLQTKCSRVLLLQYWLKLLVDHRLNIIESFLQELHVAGCRNSPR
jgi:hypothetical protein